MVRRINGYGNTYWITSAGLVITTNWRNTGKIRYLLPAKDKKGYLRVALTKNGRLITHKVHRLVANAFLPNPLLKPQVNHMDGDKENNILSNLQWATASENRKHALETGLSIMCSPVNTYPKRGELNGGAILTDKQILSIRSKFIPRIYTRKMLAKEYGVTENCIKDVVTRKSWKHL